MTMKEAEASVPGHTSHGEIEDPTNLRAVRKHYGPAVVPLTVRFVRKLKMPISFPALVEDWTDLEEDGEGKSQKQRAQMIMKLKIKELQEDEDPKILPDILVQDCKEASVDVVTNPHLDTQQYHNAFGHLPIYVFVK